MKKFFSKIIVLLLIVILFSFSGCSSSKNEVNINQNSEVYLANEDYQNYIDSFSTFAKVDNGYYFTTDLKLYFYDTE